ncbi:MAG: phosphoribosylformylglycinamidine synthase subunit PurS [Propionibacteriaceae bacterium]|jgi:phosphoribosylformylglycinamidine synthase PurS subunit|nr:phosphoribosylformylglycinamidine synthase subunit PurS [Propionibacteriaceae bacterium]
MPKVIVEVMPKPEILDPQGKAITGALKRLGYEGFAVRQGKRFEITVDGALDEQRITAIEAFADTLLANTVIEAYEVHAVVDDANDSELEVTGLITVPAESPVA